MLHQGCLILGILCILYYLLIIVYAGIRTSLSWIWILGGFLCFALWKVLSFLESHPGSAIRYVAGALLTLVILGTVLVAAVGRCIVKAMTEKPPGSLDYVIVLGAQVKGTLPSRALRRRLDCAADYAKENPETILVLSGGQGPDEGISEAECMYNYLLKKGIGKERMLPEDRSTSTRENLLYSDELYGLKNSRVGICSNNFHIYRAMLLAEKVGYQSAFGIPSSADLWMQPHNILREICCILADGLRNILK